MDVTTASKLIYQGVFISVFIIATSITLNLFSKINEVMNSVDLTLKSESISEVVTENEENYEQIVDGKKGIQDSYVLTGAEVLAIVNNYGMSERLANGTTDYVQGRKYDGKLDLGWKTNFQNVRYNTIGDIDINALFKVEYNFVYDENQNNYVGNITFIKQ